MRRHEVWFFGGNCGITDERGNANQNEKKVRSYSYLKIRRINDDRDQRNLQHRPSLLRRAGTGRSRPNPNPLRPALRGGQQDPHHARCPRRGGLHHRHHPDHRRQGGAQPGGGGHRLRHGDGAGVRQADGAGTAGQAHLQQNPLRPHRPGQLPPLQRPD